MQTSISSFFTSTPKKRFNQEAMEEEKIIYQAEELEIKDSLKVQANIAEPAFYLNNIVSDDFMTPNAGD